MLVAIIFALLLVAAVWGVTRYAKAHPTSAIAKDVNTVEADAEAEVARLEGRKAAAPATT